MVLQGEIYWADLPEPVGAEPGYRRPVVVVQNDWFNRSELPTVVCVTLTGNLRRADVPGNVVVPTIISDLPRDSVAVVTQIVTVNKSALVDRVGILPRPTLDLILSGVEVVLGRR